MAAEGQKVASIAVPGADPALAGAPIAVQWASAWLENPWYYAAVYYGFSATAVLTLVAGFPFAAMANMLTGGNAAGVGVLLGSAALASLMMWANWRWWTGNQARALALVDGWRKVQETGIHADLAPEGGAETPALERMLVRIEALAGNRPAVREAATRAVERARRLEAELGHLLRVEIGQPEADAAIGAARERIHNELAQIQGRVAELYVGLVDLDTGRDDGALEQAVARIVAELEVESPRLPREPVTNAPPEARTARSVNAASSGRVPGSR